MGLLTGLAGGALLLIGFLAIVFAFLLATDPIGAFLASALMSGIIWWIWDGFQQDREAARRKAAASIYAIQVPETPEPAGPTALDDPDWI